MKANFLFMQKVMLKRERDVGKFTFFLGNKTYFGTLILGITQDFQLQPS